ncbi:MAG: 50S ribosomal protein L10 [Candidatus Zixiibacteriota bacterium]|nr:MAG: 50S ribosomal protein L10 [candidate division Zixibacteria bacterium]
MPTQEKIDAVAEIRQLFERSGSYFVTDYQGLNVADMTVLRRNLRENAVRFLVAKNTLFRLAAKDAGQEGLEKFFQGPTAIAFASEDASTTAKILHDSYKDKELPLVKVFVMDRRQHGPEEMKRLADLPPREILLAQVVAAVESPLTQLVGALDGVFRDLVGAIDALSDKGKAEE